MGRFMQFAVLAGLAHSLCSFTQVCPGGVCVPPTQYVTPIEPFYTKFDNTMMCPELEGQPLCCNNDQNTELITKYQLIDYTFGGNVGGCDMCGANLKRLWCYFTCSPLQSTFVIGGPQEMVLDPMSSTPSYVLVMPTNFTVTERYACELYNSCKKCPYAQQVSAMQSSHGFLQFQGANSVEMGMVYITFYFVSTPPALDLSVTPCSSQSKETYGYPTRPCSCNNCDPLCGGNLPTPVNATLSGMDWLLIGISYLVIFVVTCVVIFAQYMWKRRAGKSCATDNGTNLLQAEIVDHDPYND